MRGALAAAVREVLEGRPGQEQLFSQFPAALLRERDLRGSPLLLEHYWRARAEREPARTVELMFRILGVRGRPVPDETLLRALWRHPARTWTHREAAEIARGLPPEALADPVVGRWLDRAVNRRIETAAELDRCLELCGLLAAPGRWARLPADVRARVRTTLDLAAALRGAREATGLARLFSVPEADRWAAPQALKRYRLVPAMLRLPADIGALGKLLGTHRTRPGRPLSRCRAARGHRQRTGRRRPAQPCRRGRRGTGAGRAGTGPPGSRRPDPAPCRPALAVGGPAAAGVCRAAL